jgi:hypothetical protein
VYLYDTEGKSISNLYFHTTRTKHNLLLYLCLLGKKHMMVVEEFFIMTLPVTKIKQRRPQSEWAGAFEGWYKPGTSVTVPLQGQNLDFGGETVAIKRLGHDSAHMVCELCNTFYMNQTDCVPTVSLYRPNNLVQTIIDKRGNVRTT